MLELFKRLMDDREIAEAREGPKVDLRKLVEYILRRFFKAVQDHPALLLEVSLCPAPARGYARADTICTQCFFPKSRAQLGKMRLGEADPFAESDDDTLIYKVSYFSHRALCKLRCECSL